MHLWWHGSNAAVFCRIKCCATAARVPPIKYLPKHFLKIVLYIKDKRRRNCATQHSIWEWMNFGVRHCTLAFARNQFYLSFLQLLRNDCNISCFSSRSLAVDDDAVDVKICISFVDQGRIFIFELNVIESFLDFGGRKWLNLFCTRIVRNDR